MVLGAKKLISRCVRFSQLASPQAAEARPGFLALRNGVRSSYWALPTTLPSLPSWRGSPQPLLKPNSKAEASLRADLVEIGDVVEFKTEKEGPRLGLVTWSPVGQTFDLIDLDGKVRAAKTSSVTFHLRKAYSPSSQNSNWTAPIVSRSLRQLVHEAAAKVDRLRPYLQVAHAKMSLETQVRAVDFELLCNIVAESASIRTDANHFSLSDRLAVYFAVSVFDPNFIRFDRSPLLAVSTQLSDSIYKVLHSLTSSELESFVNAFGKRLKHDNFPLPAVADPIIDIMKLYMITNDPRLEDPVTEILSLLNSEVSTSHFGTTPASVERLLHEARLLSKNPFVEDGIFTAASGGAKQDGPAAMPAAIPFPEPVFRISEDFGVSIDDTRFSDRKVVGLHVPYIPGLSAFGPTSAVSVGGKSLCLNGIHEPLLNDSVREMYSLRPGRDVTCLSISAEIASWNDQLNPSSIEVAISSCRIESLVNSRFFDSTRDATASFGPTLVNRSNTAIVDSIKELVDKFPSRGLPDFDSTYARLNDPSNGLKVLAGHWMAKYAKAHGIDVPFLYKGALKEYPAVNEPGTVDVEQVRSAPGEYEPLGLDCYTPIAFPFDSGLALTVQSCIVSHLNNPAKRSKRTVANMFNRNVLPSTQLRQELFRRLASYEALKTLEGSLNNEFGYNFFRCTILETGVSGEVVDAYCMEVGTSVKTLVNASVAVGDTIVCTEILALDPLHGVLLLRM